MELEKAPAHTFTYWSVLACVATVPLHRAVRSTTSLGRLRPPLHADKWPKLADGFPQETERGRQDQAARMAAVRVQLQALDRWRRKTASATGCVSRRSIDLWWNSHSSWGWWDEGVRGRRERCSWKQSLVFYTRDMNWRCEFSVCLSAPRALLSVQTTSARMSQTAPVKANNDLMWLSK